MFTGFYRRNADGTHSYIPVVCDKSRGLSCNALKTHVRRAVPADADSKACVQARCDGKSLGVIDRSCHGSLLHVGALPHDVEGHWQEGSITPATWITLAR